MSSLVLWAAGLQRWERRVICEPQLKVGLGAGREEEAGLERGDSGEGKGKTTPKAQNQAPKPKRANARLLLAETRSMYWQSAWSRSRSKLGEMGDRVRTSTAQTSIARVLDPMDPRWGTQSALG